MQIRTSNYQNISRVLHLNFVPVLVDHAIPADFKGMWLPELAPQPFLLVGIHKGTINREVFKVLYKKQLDRISVSGIISKILQNTRQRKICFISNDEKTYNHRKILADWLVSKGYNSPELYKRRHDS